MAKMSSAPGESHVQPQLPGEVRAEWHGEINLMGFAVDQFGCVWKHGHAGWYTVGAEVPEALVALRLAFLAGREPPAQPRAAHPGPGEDPLVRRYLSHDRPEEGDVELLAFKGGNGDWYLSIVPQGWKNARLAPLPGEDAGPDACVRITTSGERRGHHHVAGVVANLFRAMGGEPPLTPTGLDLLDVFDDDLPREVALEILRAFVANGSAIGIERILPALRRLLPELET